FPFGIFHLLKAKKNSKEALLYLIGIHPDYQNKGVVAILFDEYYKTNTRKGVGKFYRTPELEENNAIQLLWRNFNPITHKRRRTYRKDL
ncbi:MAG: GTP cyclohydrolase, partial [Flavobacteriaceae bacterium]|nr:GTP cyclohydrolase [Flavobacteriaceae bacterium]